MGISAFHHVPVSGGRIVKSETHLRKVDWLCQSYHGEDEELQKREGRDLAMCVRSDKQRRDFGVILGCDRGCDKRLAFVGVGSIICGEWWHKLVCRRG
jgi:hypothetical protein